MLDLNTIREEFAKHLSADPTGRWRMDSALAHVVEVAYQQGVKDGASLSQKEDAYELLKDLVKAMDLSFISSWQSTHGWDKELEAGRKFIETCEVLNG